MKYIELFKNGFDSTISEKIKPENWPYIGYSPNEGLALTEILKEGEIDPTSGFVDLGLSVMWASCDVGTTIPEGEGAKYPWGELSWETIPLEFDPVYMNSDMELKWKEALRPRTPSPTQVKELLDNTTATEEVLNGVSGVRYTASNGNSIFVSDVFRWTNAFTYLVSRYSSYEAVCWNPNKGIIDNTATVNSTGSQYTVKTHQYQFRGVCSNVPQGSAEFLKHGTNIAIQAEQLYCFAKTPQAILFIFTQPVTMYISNTADFTATETDTNVLDMLSTCVYDTLHIINISSKEADALVNNGIDDYIYVRFTCSNSTLLIVGDWQASVCSLKSHIINIGEAFSVLSSESYKLYRLRYSDLKGSNLKISNTGNGTVKFYISYTCDYILTDTLYILYKYNVGRRKSHTISVDNVNSWESRIDNDGFIFINFSCTGPAKLTFTLEQPETTEL